MQETHPIRQSAFRAKAPRARAAHPAFAAAATHDMLFISARPDLTPEFPSSLTHPSQQTLPPAPGRPSCP